MDTLEVVPIFGNEFKNSNNVPYTSCEDDARIDRDVIFSVFVIIFGHCLITCVHKNEFQWENTAFNL